MTNIFDASFQFPTVVFTVGVGVALVYWLFVLLGALDIDLFHGDVGGHDVDLGGGHDVDAGGTDHDAGDADAGIWHALGLGAVPLTISVSVIMLLGWCGSLMVMTHFDVGGWLAAVVLVGIIVAAVLVASVVLRPLAPVFKVKEGKTNRDYVGHLCTITTGHVDHGFGQATVEDGGTVLVIPVRCDRPDALARGHKAMIIDFDQARAAYVVEPSADMLSSDADGQP